METEELHAIYRQIKEWPHNWDQSRWAVDWEHTRSRGFYVPEGRCGTAYCFAGHAVVRAGYEIDWQGRGSTDYAIIPETGVRASIDTLAANVLGLSSREANQLFDPINTLEDLRFVITGITGKDPDDE